MMWKDYSLSYIKNNRSSRVSILIATLISALLLSLLCGLFYNAWKYEVERIESEIGGWQSRIVGELSSEEVELIKNYANVKDAVIHERGENGETLEAELFFDDMRAVFSDTPKIAELVGISPEKIAYNYELLAMYLIRGSGDTAPRLLFPLFLLITLAASVSLIIIIHNSFAVSMNARIHQFGIFSSVGATPRQIRTCLLQEAALLCIVPVIVGTLLGIGASMGLTMLSNLWLERSIPGRMEATPGYHPLVLILTLFVTVLTIWISAWLPAAKLSRLTPLEAIKNTGELQLKRRKNSRLLSLVFGVEGELAGNALKAQRKALRTASLSLVFSFLAFSVMQCFFCLSGISTRETYFERYQDVWDVMVTIEDTDAEEFDAIELVRELDGVESAIVYQKAVAKRVVTEGEMSEEMKSNGGFSHASDSYVTQAEGGFLVNAPIVILDDDSFSAYCEKIGILPRLDGAVLLNRIRDVTNPDFRHPVFMPYLIDESNASLLRQSENIETAAEIPVLSCTEEVPALREEYATIDYYELVHFIPVSLWQKIKDRIGGTKEYSYLCVRSKEPKTKETLSLMEKEINRLIGGSYPVTSENRIEERETNDKQIQGMIALFGGFCVLLALIGIGNVFSNTLGYVRQRKREFARYLSVGLTPKKLRKMFCIEALIIAGKPILISLPLVIVAVGAMLKASYINAGEFMAESPLLPILLFVLAILASVAFAYYLAWRNIRKISLAEVLRDDTML